MGRVARFDRLYQIEVVENRVCRIVTKLDDSGMKVSDEKEQKPDGSVSLIRKYLRSEDDLDPWAVA